MKISDYLNQFNENDVVEALGYLVEAEAPSGYLADREVDITDVEIFLDTYCVAVGEDGIADLITNEYNRRVETYFGAVTNSVAREMALSALKEHFLYDGYTMYKTGSPFASAFDWLLDEKYKLVAIPLDMDGEQRMVLMLDLNSCKFDVDNYINPDWALWNRELEHIMEVAKTKINV